MTDTNEYPERLLAIGDVARTFNVSVKTVRNWERRGKLSAIRTPGGHRRYRVTEVEHLLTRSRGA